MQTLHHGSCQCGAVRFDFHGTFDRFFLCHCSRCRKDTGSAHAANLFSTNGRIEWRSGMDSVRTYRVPDTRHVRSFCVDCGAAVPFVGDGMIVVPAGSLDSPLNRVPDAHIFAASRAAWDHSLSHLPEFEAFPT